MFIFVGLSWSFMSTGVSVTVSFLSIIALVAFVSPAVFLGLAVFSDIFLQFTDAIKLYHASKNRLAIVPS